MTWWWEGFLYLAKTFVFLTIISLIGAGIAQLIKGKS